MKLYAERPARLCRQILADVLLVVWIFGWFRLGREFHDRLDALRRPARQVRDASADLSISLQNTGDQLRDIQLFGEQLAAPFDAIVSSANELAEASQLHQAELARLADIAGIVVALFPILFGLTVWLVGRAMWIRRASAADRLRKYGSGIELLALRAMLNSRIDDRAVQLAGDGRPLADPSARRQLAAWELRRLGLRPRALDAPPAPGS